MQLEQNICLLNTNFVAGASSCPSDENINQSKLPQSFKFSNKFDLLQKVRNGHKQTNFCVKCLRNLFDILLVTLLRFSK